MKIDGTKVYSSPTFYATTSLSSGSRAEGMTRYGITKALNAKQNTLTAGSGISITNDTVNTAFTDVRNTQRSLPDLATSIITGYRTTIYATS